MRAFDIKYILRTSIKGQVLAYLVVKFTESPLEEKGEKQSREGKSVETISLQGPLSWKLYGATN